MANALITAQTVAALSARLVASALQLVPTVDRSFEGSFQGGSGKTVYVRVPAGAIARDRDIDDVTSQVVFDELAEKTIPITLDTHAVAGAVLSDGDLTLRLEDFGAQVLVPLADAVADRVERAVGNVLTSTPAETGLTFDPEAPEKAFTALRGALRGRGVDLSGAEPIYAIAGGNIIDALFDSGALDFSRTGDADALRAGTVGRLRGFEVRESSRVGANDIVAYPRHAIHLAIKPPVPPFGAESAIEKDPSGLIALRSLRDYDAATTADRILVSTFVGAKRMEAYRINRTGAKPVADLIPGGHVVRMTAA